jgi:hypothetical protein
MISGLIRCTAPSIITSCRSAGVFSRSDALMSINPL